MRPQDMPRTAPQTGVLFSQPIRQIVTMLLVCGLVAAGAWFIHETRCRNIWKDTGKEQA